MNGGEPWYEVKGPSKEEIINIFIEIFKKEYSNKTNLKEIIEESIKDTLDFGSYRGYYTFLHDTLKQNIINNLKKNYK